MVLLGLTASPLSSVAAKAKSGFNFLQYPHPAKETERMDHNITNEYEYELTCGKRQRHDSSSPQGEGYSLVWAIYRSSDRVQKK